eukprot:26107-Hanusia_phi.AAC.1
MANDFPPAVGRVQKERGRWSWGYPLSDNWKVVRRGGVEERGADSANDPPDRNVKQGRGGVQRIFEGSGAVRIDGK